MNGEDEGYQTSYTQELGPTGELDLLINRNYVTTTDDVAGVNHAYALHQAINNTLSY